ncbi:MAG: hypothetical protein K6E87_02285 [bacterium]|nr:hypothetical protein [bacterium]
MMKKGLIKKSMICALTISCFATLTACGMGSSSTSKVFANKDIQAYAKKKDITYDNVKDIKLTEIKTSEKTLENKFSYSLVQDKTTKKYQLYMRYSDKVYDIPTDEDEEVTAINANNDLENSFGYFIISFDSGKKMAIDYNGDVVINKNKYYSVEIDSHKRLINYEAMYTGEKTFYDLVYYKEESTSENLEIIFEVKAQFEKGLIKSFERRIINRNEIDYSVVKDNDTVDNKLKKYDFYIDSDAVYVKDLDGKLVSNFAFDFSDVKYYVLDDTMFYQKIKSVTRNDKYTYKSDNYFYQLNTYKVDLKTGKTSEVKNFDYYINNTTTITGYDEKNDREYDAAIYATLTKIEDKKLSLVSKTAMLDENGKILSDKLGEKGTKIQYFDDKTYVVTEGDYISVIDEKGKVKGTTTDFNLKIDFYNKTMFMTETGLSGYLVDNNLKVAADIAAVEYQVPARYKNGNILIEMFDEVYLGKLENGEFRVIEKFDKYNSQGTKPTLENEKHIYVTDSLQFSNIYVTAVKVGTKYNVEIHSVDGTLLKSVEGATNFNVNVGNQFCVSITTDDDTMYYAANYINAKRYN